MTLFFNDGKERWPMRAAAVATIATIAAVLAGCAGTPAAEHFYSLSAGVTPMAVATAVAPRAALAPAAPLYIELQAVSVPQQVSRNQLVVTNGAGRVELLEQERWAAPLASEIGQALSLGITSELGAIDVFRTPTPEQATVYRISTSVQRFESAPGQYALIDAVWSVRRIGSNAVLTCRTSAQEPVSAGYDALVAGHRRAVARISADISTAIRSLASGGSPRC
jgi:uncharacterized lipoprotein YmbA